MQNAHNANIQAPTPVVETPEEIKADNPLHQQLLDAEELTNTLKRLLVRYETALEQEGIRHQIETLERWMETYRHGLSAANKIANNAPTWLGDLREKLKLAADELQRLEAEGGQPATREQVKQAEDMLKASRRIDEVLPELKEMFCCEEEKEKDHA